MEEKTTYIQKVKDCIILAYKDHPYLSDFLSFHVKYVVRKSTWSGAVYYPGSQYVYINLDFVNRNDLLLSVLIHEISHHVQCVKDGYTKHDKAFREIQENILNAAFDLGYIDPRKLMIYYAYLSSYTERNKCIKMCKRYIQRNDIKDLYFIFISFAYNQKLKDYLKNNGYTFYKDSERIGWYKFYDDINDYFSEKRKFDYTIDYKPYIKLNYEFCGQVI